MTTYVLHELDSDDPIATTTDADEAEAWSAVGNRVTAHARS